MDADQMSERCPSARLVGKARLDGYRLGFTTYARTRQCGVADIVAHRGAVVWGLLYELDEADLPSLDRAEGHPVKYRRIALRVSIGDDVAENVSCYEVVSKRQFQPPSEHYLGLMTNAGRLHGFPRAYLAELEAVPCQQPGLPASPLRRRP
jgi:gamma-glutamylcyclotransferase (GGCT)/AIG2-like uncharacterized protein YtfP